MNAVIRVLVFLAIMFSSASVLAADGPSEIGFDDLWDVGEALADEHIEGFEEFRDLQDAVDELSDDDAQFEPDFDPDEMPELPAHCTEPPSGDSAGSGDDCECYEKAYKDLNFVRFYLEKLRAIYGSTKNFSEKAIAFGDSMAGLHGGFGVGWYPERVEIEKSVEKLGKTYDKKYKSYMETLKSALKKIDECEAQYHDEHDWYNRFGFIYYTFMADRYKRSD